MKSKLLILIISIILFMVLSGCSKNHVSDLQFYVVERTKISDSLTDDEIVSTARKSGRLAFDGEDISGYNWQTHTVTFKEDSVSSLGSVTEENGGSAIFKVNDTYVFIVVLKNKLIYYGGFEQGSKNPSIPLQPYIRDIDNNSFRILFDDKYDNNGDARSNKSLYSFLNEFGLLSSKSN